MTTEQITELVKAFRDLGAKKITVTEEGKVTAEFEDKDTFDPLKVEPWKPVRPVPYYPSPCVPYVPPPQKDPSINPWTTTAYMAPFDPFTTTDGTE